MLRARAASVLNSIVRQYIETAVPVSSSAVLDSVDLGVCSATIRNEMAALEEEGYISRPHHAAGSIPLDKGYRYYVGSLAYVGLPVVEQLLINHLFHQVEDEIEEWMNLACTLLAKQVQSIAMVTRPTAPATRFKHMELISLQPRLSLLVLVLEGARVKQQLLSLDKTMTQEELSYVAGRLSNLYKGKKTGQIPVSSQELNPAEKTVTDVIVRLMEAESRQDQKESFIDGLPYLLSQPEFRRGENLGNVLNLVEQKRLNELMKAARASGHRVDVVIGQENQAEDARDFSLVICRYGVMDEFTGTIGVVGPKRMQYSKAIALVGYLSLVMSKLIAELYGRELPGSGNPNESN